MNLEEQKKIEQTRAKKQETNTPKGEPRLELGVHLFGIRWNYFGIHWIMRPHHCLLLGNERGSRSRCTRYWVAVLPRKNP